MPRRKSLRKIVKNRHLSRIFKRASIAKKNKAPAVIVSPESLHRLLDEKSIDSLLELENTIRLDGKRDFSTDHVKRDDSETVLNDVDCKHRIEPDDDIEIAAANQNDVHSISPSLPIVHQRINECLSADFNNETYTRVSIEDELDIFSEDKENIEPANCGSKIDSNQTITTRDDTVNKEFEVGDKVMVCPEHKKHAGKQGVVNKITNAYAWFTVNGASIKIMKKSLMFVSESPSSNMVLEEARDDFHACSEDKENNEPANCGSKLGSNQTTTTRNAANKEFEFGDVVMVCPEHKKHAGKQGVVSKMTNVYAWFTVNGASIKIMKKSLMLVDGSMSESSSLPSNVDVEQVRKAQVMALSTEPSSAIIQSTPQQRLERFYYGTSHVNERCLLKQMLTDDIVVQEYQLSSSKSFVLPSLDKVIYLQEKRYELYYADVCQDFSKSTPYVKANKVVAHYVQTENLRELEESLADFGSMNIRKVWARRKLFLSKATQISPGNYGIYQISRSDISVDDSSFTVGCGFICERYLQRLLGDNTAAKRALGVQIRINVPSLGVFKGVLFQKHITTGPPIQLNESLRKVEASRSNEVDDGFLVVNQTFPSNTNLQVGRLFSDETRSMTNSFQKRVRQGKECKLSGMCKALLTGLNVPVHLLEQYSQSLAEDAQNLCHTHLVGVADSTNALPPNTVFMTGVKEGDLDVKELFITRSPCLEPEDGRMIKVITSKPDSMSQAQWDWLQTLHFGAVVFANPESGQRPLPELIADGDLDGDLYFVCWHKELLSHINPILLTDKDLQLCEKDGGHLSYDNEWFDKAQDFVSNVASIVHVNGLVGYLYKQSEKIALKTSVNDLDAIEYAKAYKQALEYKKHGRKILLPAHLLVDVPEKFQSLVSSQ